MIVILCIAGALTSLLIFSKINSAIQFSKEIVELFSLSKNIADKIFNYNQLIELPEPVQRYFKHVLKEGQPSISYVRLMHDGQFKTGPEKKWISIKGEQYFTTETPGFIWKGITKMFTARDMYIAGKGRLIVTLLSIVKVVNARGKIFNEAEFQRWMAESVWFPTNLLPSERLTWSAIDKNTAKLNFTCPELSVEFLVTINDKGEITKMQTTRFMDEKKKENWYCTMADYHEAGGVLIPFSAEATWALVKGDYSYASFRIKKIEFDKPERFSHRD